MDGFFLSSRRRHTSWTGDWSSDVRSSDLLYDARATPHMVVIDRSGRLVYMGAIDDKPSTRLADVKTAHRSEERRVGKECGARGRRSVEEANGAQTGRTHVLRSAYARTSGR